MSNRVALAMTLLALAITALVVGADDDRPQEQTERPAFRTESVRGKVVWVGDALKQHFDISTAERDEQRMLGVYTEDGQLLPLVEDLRGRAFRTDERLREKPMELLVRRYEKHPLLQIIRVYELKDDTKYEVDYWCDVCAIVMFEQGRCACCQDDNRLRRRLVEPEPRPTDPLKE